MTPSSREARFWYERALRYFKKSGNGGYKDAKAMERQASKELTEARYQQGVALMEKSFSGAKSAFSEIPSSYKDVAARLAVIDKYSYLMALMWGSMETSRWTWA